MANQEIPGQRAAKRSVAVVGGGWSGLACAVELCTDPGIAVTLYEAAPQLGGRARSLAWTPGGLETITIDNGQHMLVGAYRSTLDLLTRLGIDQGRGFARFPLTLTSTDGLQFRAWRARGVPAPWHLLAGLLRSRGLKLADLLALGRLGRVLKRCNFQPAPHLTVDAMLQQARATQTVAERLMRPLCLATLNTPTALASAAVFSAVLRDTLFADAQASDFLVPRCGLSALLPDRAEQHLLQHGVTIKTRSRVTGLSLAACSVDVGDQRTMHDRIVLALPLEQTGELLALSSDSSASSASADTLDGQTHKKLFAAGTESILTVYCYWSAGQAAQLADLAFGARQARLLPRMLNDTAALSPGQWLFDHGPTSAGGRLAAIVVSAADKSQETALITEQCIAQLGRELGLPAPSYTKAIMERRATFQAAAGSSRPGLTALAAITPKVVLAGDFTIADYPATLESAVRSGVQAAQAVLKSTKPR